MATLANFPMVSQLTSYTGDGRPSENAAFDCVAASIDAACRYLLNQPENSIFNPDDFKDKAYGEAYANKGTAARDYVEFCKSLGIHLYPVQGNPGQLVGLIHQYLSEEKPVIFTEPDPYVSSSLGWSHVCVFYQDGPGFITAMDPYIARPVHRTDQEWLNLLLNNEIWIAERLENNVKIDINSPLVGNYFTESSPGWWTCKQTGKIVHGEILGFYQNNNGLTDLGLPVSNEIPMDPQSNTKQYFERGCLVYDVAHTYDNPPGAGKVYKARIYGGVGQDPMISQLEAEIAQLKQAALPDPRIATYQNTLQAVALLAHQIEQKATS